MNGWRPWIAGHTADHVQLSASHTAFTSSNSVSAAGSRSILLMSLDTRSDTVPRTHEAPRSSCHVILEMCAYKLSSYLRWKAQRLQASDRAPCGYVRPQENTSNSAPRARLRVRYQVLDSFAALLATCLLRLQALPPLLQARAAQARTHASAQAAQDVRPDGHKTSACRPGAHLSCSRSSASSASAWQVAASRPCERSACAPSGSSGVAAACAAATSRLRPAMARQSVPLSAALQSCFWPNLCLKLTSYGIAHLLLAGLRCLDNVTLQLLHCQRFHIVIRPLVLRPQRVHDLEMVLETQGARHLAH